MPEPAEAVLTLPRQPGRWRTLRHRALLVPVVLGGWSWFGIAGTVPLLVWWWCRRPVASTDDVLIGLAEVRWARLGALRTCLALHSGRLEIFNDELHPADLARLRRTLRSHLAGAP